MDLSCNYDHNIECVCVDGGGGRWRRHITDLFPMQSRCNNY